jgi:enoyl-CoA hydratase
VTGADLSADRSPTDPGPGVTTTLSAHLLTVTLDRGRRHNALSTAVVDRLVEVFDDAHADPEVWAVLLRGEGPSFCAGRDLHEVLELDQRGEAGEPVPMRGPRRTVFEVIAECGVPTVAALHGNVLGGGAELALACDVRIGGDDLAIGFPEARRGFGANFASVMLPRTVGIPRAYDLLYTARTLDAAEAAAIGLVQQVVAATEVDARARAYAESIVANAPLTTQRYKAMVAKGASLPLPAALRLEAGPDPYASDDRREGVAAWLERRPPRWAAR